MISRQAHRTLAFLLAVLPLLLRGEGSWEQLRLGMSAEDAIASLGRPLLRTAGRGFETLTYDNGAELLLYGSLVGWTTPASPAAASTSHDVWRANRSGTYFPTFAALLPKRVVRDPTLQFAAGPPPGRPEDFRLPAYGYRR